MSPLSGGETSVTFLFRSLSAAEVLKANLQAQSLLNRARDAMELTFLIAKDGRNLKRTHSRRACTPCRQKKKRCFHGRSTCQEGSQETEPHIRLHGPADARAEAETPSRCIIGSTSPTSYGPERRNTSRSGENEEQRIQSNTSSISNARGRFVEKEAEARPFACDSNPLVALLDDPQSRLLKGQAQKGDVGAWLHDERITSHPNALRGLHAVAREQRPNLHGNLGLLPPKTSQVALIKIYFCRIHPLLPLLDEDDIFFQYANGSLSLPLLQSICLVAAKDQGAVSFLSLGSDGVLLPVAKFSQQIYKDILSNMPNRDERNRITTIQVLTLLSLHEWGPSGSEDSSLSLVQAIHHAQTIGLHLRRPDCETSLKDKALFWSLWSLDKWNSAINGRPVIIHDCDLGQTVTDVIPLFKPPFRIWLLLADQLGRVIGFFRPMTDGTREQDTDLSTFEEIIETSDSWDIEPELLDSLELYHHAIVILSTYSTELQGRLHSRVSDIRQSHSTLTIAAFCRRKNTKNLLPIPVSTYSLSLAFSITYRQLRKAKLPSNRLLARENLEIFHQALRSLSGTWWLAAVVMRLGTHALESTRRQEIHEQPDQYQAQEVVRTRPSTVGPSSVSNIHCTPQIVSSYENFDASLGNITTPDETLSMSTFSSDLDDLFENYDLSTVEGSYFDSFFQNFLDVNFPSSLGEQLLGGREALV